MPLEENGNGTAPQNGNGGDIYDQVDEKLGDQGDRPSSHWWWPVPASNRITQGYGSGHQAVDVGVDVGQWVIAPTAGTVYTEVDPDGYGNYIRLETVDGYTVILAHLDDFHVNSGTQVSAGTALARSGNTGRSSGPHVHYEIRDLSPFDVTYREYDWNQIGQPPGRSQNGNGVTGNGSTPGPEGIRGMDIGPFGQPPPPPIGQTSVIDRINWATIGVILWGAALVTGGVVLLATEETIKLAIRPVADAIRSAAEVTKE